MKKTSQSSKTSKSITKATWSIAIVSGVALMVSVVSLILVVITMNYIDDEIVTQMNENNGNINSLIDCQTGNQNSCDILKESLESKVEE